MIDLDWLNSLPAEARRALLTDAALLLQGSRLEDYRPYAKQRDFHEAGGFHRERMLIAGNQLGKTFAAGNEVAMHLTGMYPEWWKGLRFTRPNHWLAGSESGELTRRGVQRILFGRDPKTEIGTGSIPRDQILAYTWARGVPDLLDTVTVQHTTGGKSTISLKSYDQGRSKWQADTVDGVWFDEEPPQDVYTEGLTRTNTSLGPIILTLTPLLGMSQVVGRFMVEKAAGTHVTTMTLDDAEHYTAEQRRAITESYPEHEREARTRGVPSLGSGRVFPIAEDRITIEPVAIADHWPRICGLDFGWDHPSAAVWLAWDRDADTVYVYDCYRERNVTPAVQAASIRARGAWIPVAWPADGMQTEKGTGRRLVTHYTEAGCNMLSEHAQYEKSADSTPQSLVSVEAGVMDMLTRMQSGRLKVFKHLADWLEEFRLYHRKEGRIVKERDDLMSATRYGLMMLRHATTEKPANKRKTPPPYRGIPSPHAWMAC